MTWRLLEDHGGGLQEWFRKDPATGKITIRLTQDVESVLEHNKALITNESGNWKGDLHHIASIPKVLMDAWWKEFGGDPMSKENMPEVIKRLNNRDFSKLRTKSGRL